MNKNKKIIIAVLFVSLIVIIGIIISFLIKYNSANRASPKFKNENSNSNIEQNGQIGKILTKKYSKVIDNVKLELDILSQWQYEEMPRNEENDFYKYALKIYKNNENQYAMLYYYNNQFGVCGTGRTSKTMVLNNGKKASIGYYDGNKDWKDISFYDINKNVAFVNYGLINDDANEIIDFIKTINITENNS